MGLSKIGVSMGGKSKDGDSLASSHGSSSKYIQVVAVFEVKCALVFKVRSRTVQTFEILIIKIFSKYIRNNWYEFNCGSRNFQWNLPF